MTEDWLPPKSHYVKDHAFFDKQATEALERVYAELQSKTSALEEHGLTISKATTWLEVKRGPLELITISFNVDNKGYGRIVNHINMHLHNKSHFDFQNSEEGEAAFKPEMRAALDGFYNNRQYFATLGLG